MATFDSPRVVIVDTLQADPEDYNTGALTEGSDYIQLEFFDEMKDEYMQAYHGEQYPGQKVYFYKLNQYNKTTLTVTGLATSKAAVAKFKKFFRIRMADTTNKDFFLPTFQRWGLYSF